MAYSLAASKPAKRPKKITSNSSEAHSVWLKRRSFSFLRPRSAPR
jgi:hypothetical protein